MGTSALSIAMPLPTLESWDDWYENATDTWENECDQPRATTYYFSSSGDDATGDGTIGNPFETISKAQTLLAASSGDIALLFKRGEEFPSETGLTVSGKNNVTIGAYGVGADPILHTFTVPIAASGWSQAGGTDRWTRAQADRIGWIRENSDDDARLSAYTWMGRAGFVNSSPAPSSTVFRANTTSSTQLSTTDDAYNGWKLAFLSGSRAGEEQTILDYTGSTREFTLDSALTGAPAANDHFLLYSESAIEAKARSWVWTPGSSGVLHVNRGTGLDPNGITYEAIDSSNWTSATPHTGTGITDGDGVLVSNSDFVLIENLRLDGWGCDASWIWQTYPIDLKNVGTELVVVRNVEAYYCGKHGPSTQGAGTGGLTLFKNVTAGYANRTCQSANIFNAYQSSGEHQFIFENCRVRFAGLPDYLFQGSTTAVYDANTSITGFFGHTSSNDIALGLWVDCSYTKEDLDGGTTYGDSTVQFNSGDIPGTATDPTTWVAVVKGMECIHEGEGRTCFLENCWQINNRYKWTWPNSGQTTYAFNPTTAGGAAVNCIWDITDTYSGSSARSFVNSSTTNANVWLLNCHIQFTCTSSSANSFNLNSSASNGVDMIVANTILAKSGTKAFTCTAPANDTDHFKGIRAIGVTGADSGLNYAVLAGVPTILATPTSGDGLFHVGTADPLGLGRLEFDFNGGARPVTPSIGPVDVPGVDLTTNIIRRLALASGSNAWAQNFAQRMADGDAFDSMDTRMFKLILAGMPREADIEDAFEAGGTLNADTLTVLAQQLGGEAARDLRELIN